MTNFGEHYHAVHGGRENWTGKAIDALAKEGIPFEDFFRRKVNHRTPYFGKFERAVARGLTTGIPVWPLSILPSPDGNCASNDHCLVIMGGDRKMRVVGRIETECRTKGGDWGDILPRSAWPYGLTLLTRKGYDRNLFFVKHNKSLTSAFCIDCRWLVSGIESGKVGSQELADALSKSGVITNGEKWIIPWSVVDANRYGAGKGKAGNRGGTVCLVENGRWEDMWIFFADRLGAARDDGFPDWTKISTVEGSK